MRIATLLLSATLLPLVARPASAQCPTAADGFDLGGVAGTVVNIGVFDLGSGPELYIAGRFRGGAGGVAMSNVGRWDGTSWQPLEDGVRWDDGRSSSARVLLPFDDGGGTKLYVSGWFERAGDVLSSKVAAWDGSSWHSAGTALRGLPADLEIYDDGSGPTLWVVTNPYSTEPGGLWKLSGGDWALASTAILDGDVYDMAVFDDGTGSALYVAGVFAAPFRSLARWDGSSWSEVGGGLASGLGANQSPFVWTLAVWDDGGGEALFVGGRLYGQQQGGVARYRGGSWTPLPGILEGKRLAPIDFGQGPELYASGTRLVGSGRLSVRRDGQWQEVVAAQGPWWPLSWAALDRGHGKELVVSHTTTLAGSRFVASWDGSSWKPFGDVQSGLSEPPLDLFALDLGQGERLLSACWSPPLPDSPSPVVAWNGAAWDPLPSVGGWTAMGLREIDEGGTTTLLGFDLSGAIYRFENGRWTEPWNPWITVTTGPVMDIEQADLGSGLHTYFAGQFGEIRHDASDWQFVNNAAGWDGSAFYPLGVGNAALLGTVEVLEAFDDGSGPALFAGGDFFSLAAPIQNVARWDGTAWQPLGNGLDAQVTAFAVFDDGSGTHLFAGGDFATAGGAATAHVARWDGQAWSALGAGIASDGPTFDSGYRVITDMQVFDDGNGPALYVGGTFHHAGGVTASNVARWNGSTWEPLGSGTTHPVRALEVFDDALYLAGPFLAFDGVPSANIAKWGDRCALAANVAFCEATAAACPCGNAGDGAGGCDTPQATGGVRLEFTGFQPGPPGQEVVTFLASGYPVGTTPTVLLLRGSDWARDEIAFGDGRACLMGPYRLAHAGIAASGYSVHTILEQDGTGVRYYQLRYRSNPAAFCDATAAFNTSNAFKVTW